MADKRESIRKKYLGKFSEEGTNAPITLVDSNSKLQSIREKYMPSDGGVSAYTSNILNNSPVPSTYTAPATEDPLMTLSFNTVTSPLNMRNIGAVNQLQDLQGRMAQHQVSTDYASLVNNPDFANRSGYVSTRNDALSEYKGRSGGNTYSDILYETVNRNPDVLLNPRDEINATDIQKYSQVSDEQRDIYNYLYSTRGADEARRYLDLLDDKEMNAAMAQEAERQAREFASERPIEATLQSFADTAWTSISSAPEMALDYLMTGDIDPNASYNIPSIVAGATRDQVASDIASGKYRINNRFNAAAPITQQMQAAVRDPAGQEFYRSSPSEYLGSSLYQAVTSRVDSMIGLALGGGSEAAGLAMMGVRAGVSAAAEAKRRGYSDDRAMLQGISVGLIEAATERVGFDALFSHTASESLWKSLSSQAVPEVLEEGAATILDFISDALIGQDKSRLVESMNNYKDQGKSNFGAIVSTLGDLGLDALQDAFVGALAGGLGGVTAYVLNYSEMSAAQRQRGEMLFNDLQMEYYALANNSANLTEEERADRINRMRELNATVQREFVENDRANLSRRDKNLLADSVRYIDSLINMSEQNQTIAQPADDVVRTQYDIAGQISGPTLESLANEMYAPAEAQNRADLQTIETETENVTPAEENAAKGRNWTAQDMMNPASVEESLQQIDQVAESMMDTRPELGELIQSSYEAMAEGEGRYISTDYFTEAMTTLYNMGQEGATAREAAQAVREMNLPTLTMQTAFRAFDLGRQTGGETNGRDQSNSNIQIRADSNAAGLQTETVETVRPVENGRAGAEGEGNLRADSEEVVRKVTNSDIFGKKNGGSGEVNIVRPTKELEDLKNRLAKELNFDGEVFFVDSEMTFRDNDGEEFKVDGYISQDNSKLFVNRNPYGKSAEQVLTHEFGHFEVAYDKSKVRAFRDAVTRDDPELAALIEQGYGLLLGIVGNDALIWEEAWCNQKAGINEFKGQIGGQFYSEAVERGAKTLSGAFSESRQTRGSPQARISRAEAAARLNGNLEQDLDRKGVEILNDDTATKRFSVTTWNATDKKKVLNALVKAGYQEQIAQKWINAVSSISAEIAADPYRLDYVSDDTQVMLKNNQEYYKTLDASTLCAKRLLYQGTFNRITELLPNTILMPDDLIRIRQIMAEKEGNTVPCGFCYVESRRKTLSEFAGRWLKEQYKSGYKPTMYELTSTNGQQKLRAEHPDVYEQYTKWMRGRGTANPKIVELRTSYKGDIQKLGKSTIDKITRIGGLRIQSFSDFETVHLIDMMQAILDMSAKKLTAQAYTKVPNFAWAFGDTGIKINLSLVGQAKNGKLVFDSREGMDIKDAMKLRERYSDNVGTILVGANRESILLAMADDRIDFIIPFHRSGWSKAQFEALGLYGYEDFQAYQNERNLDGSSIEGGNLYPIDYWDYNLSGKENVERYLQICKEQKRIPKFEQFLVDNGDGSWSLQPDGSTDGYWKMLIDFKMYNNEGIGVPQQAVAPNFNMEECQRILKEYDGTGNRSLPVDEESAQRFVTEYNADERRFSRSDMPGQISFGDLARPEPENKPKPKTRGIVVDGQMTFDDLMNHFRDIAPGASPENIKRAARESKGLIERIQKFQQREIEKSETGKYDANAKTVALGITSEFIEKGYVNFNGKKLSDDPIKARQELAALASIYRNPNFETSRLFFMNGNEIVGNSAVSSYAVSHTGFTNFRTYNEFIDDLLPRMERMGADGFYMMHNHPDGITRASEADKRVSRNLETMLRYAGVSHMFRGEIIIDHTKYGFLKNGRSSQFEIEDNSPAISERKIDHPLLYKNMYDWGTIGQVARDVVHSKDYSSLVYVSNDGIRGIQEVRNGFVKSKDFAAYVRNRKLDFGSHHVFLIINEDESLYKSMSPLYRDSTLFDVVMSGENGIRDYQVIDNKRRGKSYDSGGKEHHVFENTDTVQRFSRSVDSAGNQLSEAQQEFFKDSKMRDENGNLLVVYHGSSSTFTEFDSSRAPENGRLHGDGFYFTPEETAAKFWGGRSGYIPKIYESYLNIKNPYVADNSIPASEDVMEHLRQKVGEIYDRNSSDKTWFGSKLTRDNYIKDITDGKTADGALYTLGFGDDITSVLKSLGYDGLIAKDSNGKIYEIVAYEPNQIKLTSNKNPSLNNDIRFSRSDSRYLELAKDPTKNETELREMVRQAAADAGYTTEAYHGTLSGGFTVFDPRQTPLDRESNASWFFADQEKAYRNYAALAENEIPKNNQGIPQTYATFIRLSNPLVVDAKGERWTNIPVEGIGDISEYEYSHRNWYKDGDKNVRRKYKNRYTGQESKSWTDTEEVSVFAEMNGYDGVIFNNLVDGNISETPGTVYAVFDSSNIKSADPVTYDDSGKVIPLSERFQTTNNDIRFSPSQYSLRSQYEELEAEIRKQKSRAEYFKGQTHLKLMKEGADRYQIEDSSLKKFAKTLNDYYSSSANITEDLRGIINDYLNGRINGYDDLHTSVMLVAGNIVSRAKVLMPVDDRYDRLKQYLKTTPISIANEDKSDIPDFEQWRRSNLSKIRVSNSGARIDTVYAEMQEEFGRDLFPDEITHPSDMLLQIERVLDAIAPEYISPYGTNSDTAEAVEDCASDIIGRIMNNDGIELVPPTFADKQKERRLNEVEAVRQRYQAALERVRKQRDDRISDLKKHAAEVQLNKRLRRIDSNNRTRLLNIVKRLQNKKLPAVQRQRLNEIIGDIDTISKSLTGRTVARLTELQSWYQNQKETNPDFLADPHIEKLLTRLSSRHIGDMTQAEVAELTVVLLGIENEIRTERELIDLQDRRDTYQAAEAIVDDIRKSDGTKMGLVQKMDEPFIMSVLAPERAIRRLTGYNDGDPLQGIMQQMSDGELDALEFQRKAGKIVQRFIDDEEFMDSITGKKAKKVTFKGVVNGKVEEIAITPAERISLYLHSLNDDNLRHIQNGGIRVPDFELLRQGKTEDAYNRQVTKQVRLKPSEVRAITAGMSEKERAYANAIRSYFNGMSQKEINEVSEKLKGYSLAQVENYFPIETDSNFLKREYESIKRDGTIEGMGFLKERVQASNPIMLREAHVVMNQSVRMTSKYVGLAIPIRNFNKVMKVGLMDWEGDGETTMYTGSIHDALAEKWGRPGINYLEKFVGDLQNTRFDEDAFGTFFNRITSNYAGAVLELNAAVAVKQSASYPTAMAVLGFRPIARALTDFEKVDTDLINKYTPIYWYRAQGFSTTELGDLASGKKNVPAALKWIQFMDLATTRKLWRASEYYIREERRDLVYGTDAFYEEVAKIYETVIHDTQPNYTQTQRPQLLRSKNALTRALNMFKTQPYQNFNILYDAVQDYKAKGREFKRVDTPDTRAAFEKTKKKLARAIVSQLLASFVFSLMQFAWDLFRTRKQKYANKKGEVTLPSVVKGFSINMLTNGFGMVPLGSEAFEFIGSSTDKIAKSLGGDSFFDQSFYGIDVPVVETLNNLVEGSGDIITKVIDAAASIASGDNVDAWELTRSIYKDTSSMFQVMGVPASNVVGLLNAVAGQSMRLFNGKYVGEYYALRIQGASNTEMYKVLYRAYENDMSAYSELYDIMISDGYKESAIKSFFKKMNK